MNSQQLDVAALTTRRQIQGVPATLAATPRKNCQLVLMLDGPTSRGDTGGLPPNALSEAVDMATTVVRDRLEKLESTISDLDLRMRKAEQSSILRWFRKEWKALVPIFLTLIAAIAAGTGWAVQHVVDDRVEARMKAHNVDQLASDVSTIKGQLAEISGFLKVLTANELHRQASLSKETFQKQIPTVAEAVSAARVVHAATPPEVMASIHQKLVDTPAGTPGYWKAAAQFVNYKSDLRAHFEETQLPNCFASSFFPVLGLGNGKGYWEATIILKNCEADLDAKNLPQFEQLASHVIKGVPFSQIHYSLKLINVRVVYHGGFMLPLDNLTMQNCRFQIDTEREAPALAKTLTKGLLFASDDSTIMVNLSAQG